MRKDKQFIFNVLAAAGVGLTMAATIKDTAKACKLVNNKMSFKEKVQKTWRCYIPSSLVAASTILCIVYSDHISQKEKASLLAALMSVQNNYNSLRSGVDEVCDEDTKKKILNQMVREKIPKDVYLERTEDKLFYEEYSSRFFISTIDNVLKAEYEFNKQLSIMGMCSLNQFYGYLGISETESGEYLGWSVYDGYFGCTAVSPWVDFTHSKMESDDGCEYYFIGYSNQPEVNYDML